MGSTDGLPMKRVAQTFSKRLATFPKRLGALATAAGMLTDLQAQRSARLRAEGRLTKVEGEHKSLLAKYKLLTHDSTETADALSFDHFVTLAKRALDPSDVKTKIEASHETFDNR